MNGIPTSTTGMAVLGTAPLTTVRQLTHGIVPITVAITIPMVIHGAIPTTAQAGRAHIVSTWAIPGTTDGVVEWEWEWATVILMEIPGVMVMAMVAIPCRLSTLITITTGAIMAKQASQWRTVNELHEVAW